MSSQRSLSGPGDPILSKVLEADRQVSKDATPIFVLGAMRSGVRAVADALATGANLEHDQRGDAFGLLQGMLDEVDWHYGTLDPAYLGDREGNLIANTSREAVEAHVTNWFHARLGARGGARSWVSSCIERRRGGQMVRSVSEALRQFPQARFVFVARRSIEFLHSCLQRQPAAPLQHFAWVWQDTIDAWSKVRPQIEGRYIEVRQEDMANDPATVGSNLAGFIDADEATAQRIASTLGQARSGQDHFAQEFRALGLDEMRWNPSQKRIVRDICSTIMDGVGWSFEPAQVAPARPLRLFAPDSPATFGTHNLDGPESFRAPDAQTIEMDTSANSVEPVEMRYLGVPLSGICGFAAQLSLAADASCGVAFRIRLEEADGRKPVRRMQRIVQPGETVDWNERFEAIPAGWYDLVVAAMPHEAQSGATAVTTRWVDARLLAD